MDFGQVIEFCTNHWQLVGAFFGALIALFVYESRKQGSSVSPQQLVQMLNQNEAIVVDVRDTKDFKSGHITSAKNIPYAELKNRVPELQKFKEKAVVLVCAIGQYSGAAGKLLHQQGFKQVLRLSGGLNTWSTQGLPLVKK